MMSWSYYINIDKGPIANLVNLNTELAQMVKQLMKADYHNTFDSVTFGITAVTFNLGPAMARIDLVAI